jgi:phosphoribosyl-ATP pyrophosphohydrolase/phosphoribosyl-AMP cyclohydrolase
MREAASGSFDKPRSNPEKCRMDAKPPPQLDAQLAGLKFDANGLVPIIVQDYQNNEVLMMAFANREALAKTIETGKVHTYSRSRGRLALKGESSAHYQHVKKVLTDCDKDVVLIQVVQDVAACHEGYRSCFFREYEEDGTQWKTIAEKAFDPDKVYSK